MKWNRTLLSLILIFSISISAFAMDSGMLLFTSPNEKCTDQLPKEGFSIWKSDGTPNGTIEVKKGVSFYSQEMPFYPYKANSLIVNGNLVFYYDHGLWRSDGTEKGTLQLLSESITIEPNFNFKGWIYFFKGYPEKQLWRTDGSVSGTETNFFGNVPGLNFTDTYSFIKAGNVSYFLQKLTDNNKDTYTQLWKSDGTARGTMAVGDKMYGRNNKIVAAIGNQVLFSAEKPKNPRYSWLYTSDGTLQGTQKIKDRHPKLYFGGHVDFATALNFRDKFVFTSDTYWKTPATSPDKLLGTGLWCSNGTQHGTFLMKYFKKDRITDITVAKDKFFFLAKTYRNGRELWVSNGTRKGTQLVKDIREGRKWGIKKQYHESDLTLMDDVCYFWANDGIHGEELWRSDGTKMGTVMIKDINTKNNTVASNSRLGQEDADIPFQQDAIVPEIDEEELDQFAGDYNDENEPNYIGSSDSEMNDALSSEVFNAERDTTGSERLDSRHIIPNRRWNLMDGKGTLYFFTEDGVHGKELWKSDGTENGTVLIKDINPGKMGIRVGMATIIDGVLYFNIYTPALGNTLWKSDGTEKGTVLVKKMSDKDFPSNGEHYWVPDFIHMNSKATF